MYLSLTENLLHQLLKGNFKNERHNNKLKLEG